MAAPQYQECRYANYSGLKQTLVELCQQRGLRYDGTREHLLGRLTVNDMGLSSIPGHETMEQMGARLWSMSNALLTEEVLLFDASPKRYKACLVPQILTHTFRDAIDAYRSTTATTIQPLDKLAKSIFQTMTHLRTLSFNELVQEQARFSLELTDPNGRLEPAALGGLAALSTMITGLCLERFGIDIRGRSHGSFVPHVDDHLEHRPASVNESRRFRSGTSTASVVSELPTQRNQADEHRRGPASPPLSEHLFSRELNRRPADINRVGPSDRGGRVDNAFWHSPSPSPPLGPVRAPTPDVADHQIYSRQPSHTRSWSGGFPTTNHIPYDGVLYGTRGSNSLSQVGRTSVNSLSGNLSNMYLGGEPAELPSGPGTPGFESPPSIGLSNRMFNGMLPLQQQQSSESSRASLGRSQEDLRSQTQSSPTQTEVSRSQSHEPRPESSSTRIALLPEEMICLAYQLDTFTTKHPKIGRFSGAYNKSVAVHEEIASIMARFPPNEAEKTYPAEWVVNPPLATVALNRFKRLMKKEAKK